MKKYKFGISVSKSEGYSAFSLIETVVANHQDMEDTMSKIKIILEVFGIQDD